MKTDFYCKNCKTDLNLEFRNPSKVKIVGNEVVEYSENENVRWARCSKCDKKLYRFPGNLVMDYGVFGFYSKYVRMLREKFWKDVLQPDDPKFKLYYREAWEKLEREREEKEMVKISDKTNQDKYYQNLINKGANKKWVFKAREEEEKLKYGGN